MIATSAKSPKKKKKKKNPANLTLQPALLTQISTPHSLAPTVFFTFSSNSCLCSFLHAVLRTLFFSFKRQRFPLTGVLTALLWLVMAQWENLISEWFL
jgi:hypothetical protein